MVIKFCALQPRLGDLMKASRRDMSRCCLHRTIKGVPRPRWKIPYSKRPLTNPRNLGGQSIMSGGSDNQDDDEEIPPHNQALLSRLEGMLRGLFVAASATYASGLLLGLGGCLGFGSRKRCYNTDLSLLFPPPSPCYPSPTVLGVGAGPKHDP